MISRQDIVWLGVSAAVMGALIGGLMLGLGLVIATGGGHGALALGYVLILPAAPVAGGIGWLLSRRLAAQLNHPESR